MDRYDLAARIDNDGLWDWNLTTGRIHFSSRWASLLGCEECEVGNTPDEWFRRVHPEDLKQLQRGIDAHVAGDSLQFENKHRMLHKDGTYRWMCSRAVITRDESGHPFRIAGSHSDITPERVVDALTGLPNRLLLLDRLTRSLERAKRHDDFLFAVLLLDLDRSDALIERIGAAAGDLLLISAARRLETSLHAGDGVARLGRGYVVAHSEADEFIILLEGLNEVGEAKIVAERLLKEISAPFGLDGREVFLTASIGIALSVTGYRHAEEALRDADTALYRAKSLGKGRCEVFDTAILDSAQSHLQLEADLQGALGRQELSVCYQPIVSLATSRIAGFEALMRWNHPVWGMISPQEFIPIAERSGCIVPLGRWILHEACRQLKVWQEDPRIPGDLWVSVNFSSKQFMQPSLSEEIREVLCDVQLHPSSLMLELTEGVLMENPEAASSLLMKLRVTGTRIGIDDFGTGYSSLSYLRRFPVDFLKIGHSFIRSLGTSQDSLEIVRTICSLAHQLGLHVIAEGIENAGQLDLVRSFKCDYGQGFYFSKAINRERAEALLREGLSHVPGAEADKKEEKPETIATTDPPLEELAVPLAAHPGADGPRIEQIEGWLTRKKGFLFIGLTALVLLLMGGLLARFDRLTLPPVAYSSAPFLQGPEETPGKTAAAGKTDENPAPQESRSPLSRDATTTQPPVSARPPIKKPVSYSYSVLHNHLLGSCQGILKISQNSLSFVSEKEKDSFDLKYSECSYLLEDDQLTIKAGPKTYHFKSAAANSKEENRSQLRAIVQSISRLRPDAALK